MSARKTILAGNPPMIYARNVREARARLRQADHLLDDSMIVEALGSGVSYPMTFDDWAGLTCVLSAVA